MEEARARGVAAARGFDAHLRLVEAAEREALLTRQLWRPTDQDSEEVAQLRAQVEALEVFNRSVLGSRSWRLLQRLRRYFGRAW